MERLTKKIDSCTVFPEELIGVTLVPDNPIMCKMLLRLAAYEDTGLTPEEITKIGMETEAGCVRAIARMYGVDTKRLRELAAAGRDERLVVLPCKETEAALEAMKNE